LLQREVNMLALRYQISLAGTVWAAPQNEKDAKMNRILGLQILLEDDDRLLRFVNGDFIDEMFKQFTGVTGVKENKGRKIDIVDAISMAQRFLPSAPPDEKRQRDREKEQEQENLRQHYQRMFGNDVPYVKSPEPQPELEQKSKTDPRLAQLAKCLPPGMRI